MPGLFPELDELDIGDNAEGKGSLFPELEEKAVSKESLFPELDGGPPSPDIAEGGELSITSHIQAGVAAGRAGAEGVQDLIVAAGDIAKAPIQAGLRTIGTLEGPPETIMERAITAPIRGALSSAEGLAGAARVLGLEGPGKSAVESLESLRMRLSPREVTLIERIGEGFGSTAPYLVLGGVAGGIAKGVPALARVMQIGVPVVADAMVNAGMVFNQAIEDPKFKDTATLRALGTFIVNLPLNAATYAFGWYAKGSGLLKAAKTATLEGGQEGVQEMIQNRALEDPVLQNVVEAFGIGFIVGGVMGGFDAIPPKPRPDPGPIPRDIDPELRTQISGLQDVLGVEGLPAGPPGAPILQRKLIQMEDVAQKFEMGTEDLPAAGPRSFQVPGTEIGTLEDFEAAKERVESGEYTLDDEQNAAFARIEAFWKFNQAATTGIVQEDGTIAPVEPEEEPEAPEAPKVPVAVKPVPATGVSAMTLEEFKQVAPDADTDMHRAAVKQALLSGTDVDPAIVESHEGLAAEVQEEMTPIKPYGTPLQDEIRKMGGINPASAKEYRGELENTRKLTREGGKTVSQLVEDFASRGLIDDASENALFDALEMEARGLGGAVDEAMVEGTRVGERAAFYNPAADIIEKSKQEKMSGEQARALFKNLPEADRSQIETEIEGKKSVTKSELAAFAEEAFAPLGETILGEAFTGEYVDASIRLEEIRTLREGQNLLSPIEGHELRIEEATIHEKLSRERNMDSPKFSEFTLPGGKNYKEILIQIPGNEFRSPHWDKKGIVVSIRTDTHETPDGKKVQVIQEVQSDLHQKGRKEGYQEGDRSTLEKEKDKVSLEWEKAREKVNSIQRNESEALEGVTDSKARLVIQKRFTKEIIKAREELLEISDNFYRLSEEVFQAIKGVPDAPFKKSWPELGFRRALKEAVDNNAEFLAWTTGEQQAARYDLSKQVSSISYRKDADGDFEVFATHKDSGKKIEIGTHPAQRLPDVVGKEIAEKIVAGYESKPGFKEAFKRDHKEISGLDLKVGGEGMKKFYDRDLRKIAEKIGKKYGAKVEAIEIADTQVQALRITPELAEAVKTGQAVSMKEAQVAYPDGPRRARERAAERIRQVELPLGPEVVAPEKKPSVIAKTLMERGVVEARGLRIRDIQDLGEAAALFRDPKLEHFVVYAFQGKKIVDVQVFSSGAPDQVMVTEDMKSDIEAWLKKLGADEFALSHNHPTGDPTPSSDADIPMTIEIGKRIGVKFMGQVVVDDVEFSFITPEGKTSRHTFAEPKAPSRKTIPFAQARSPEAVAIVARNHGKGKSVNIILTDGKGRTISVQILESDANLETAVNQSIKRYNATQAFVVIPTGYQITSTELNARVRDVVEVGPDGGVTKSYHASGELAGVMVKAEPPGFTYRVAEKASVYDSDEFSVWIHSHGVKVGGSLVTVGPIIDSELKGGRIKRGKQVKVIGIDIKNSRLLIEHEGQSTTANIENFEKKFGKVYAKSLEIDLLKEIRKSLAPVHAGARWGMREGVRTARKEIMAKLREEKSNLSDTKDEAVEFIKKSLPLAKRGAFLTPVKNVKTKLGLARLMFKVDDAAQEIYKVTLRADIVKLFKRTLDSPSISVEQKQKMKTLLAHIELKGHSQKTLDSLKATREWLNSEINAGKDVEFVEVLLEKISVLGRRPLKEIHEVGLEEIYEELKALVEIGKTQQRVRLSLHKLKKENRIKEVVAELVPIAMREEKKAGPFDKALTTSEELGNNFVRAHNFSRNAWWSVTQMDTLIDILGGRTNFTGSVYRYFKKNFDVKYHSFQNRVDELTTPLQDIALKHKFGKENFSRIGLHAIAVQVNGKEQLLAMGIEQERIDGNVLSKEENEWYVKAREVIESLRPKTASLMASLYNKDMGSVDDYWPFQTDWDAMSELDVAERLGNQFDNRGFHKRSVERGFTKTRNEYARQTLMLDAYASFLGHIEDSVYFQEMQEEIKLMSEVAHSPEVREAAGDYGVTLLRDYMDVLARAGGVEGTRQSRALRMFRVNLSASQLGLRLSSTLIQPTALFDGMMLLGGNRVMKSTKKIAFQPEWRDFVIKNMPEIRHRVGDDFAISELSQSENLAKLQRLGFLPLQFVDQYTAMSVALGAYEQAVEEMGLELDIDNPVPEALETAQRTARITQASALFKDVGLAQSRGNITGNRDMDRAVLQFMTFVLNRFETLTYTLPEMARRGKKMEAAWGYFYFMQATIMETLIRRGTAAGISATLMGLGFGYREEKDSFAMDLFRNTIGTVPFLSSLFYASKYQSNPVPIADTAMDTIAGTGWAASAAWKLAFDKEKRNWKTTRQFLRGTVQALEGLLALSVGLPGIGQGSDMLQDALRDRPTEAAIAERKLKEMIKKAELFFPFKGELKRLENEFKENPKTLTSREKSRLGKLRNGKRRMSMYIRRYKQAVARGDTRTMHSLATGAVKEMDAMR